MLFSFAALINASMVANTCAFVSLSRSWMARSLPNVSLSICSYSGWVITITDLSYELVKHYGPSKWYGEDATELLNCFKDQFKVDLSKFRFNDYFPSEGDWILPSLFRFIMYKKRKEYKPLTLSDLNKAIDIGYLE